MKHWHLMLAASLSLAAFGLVATGQSNSTRLSEVASKTTNAIPYRTGPETTEYMRERCLLDIYLPEQTDEFFATIVWFHGGGLQGGERFIPGELKGKQVAVVAPSYRLHPRVQAPAYIEDAAAAVAWVFENIEAYGGDPDRIYVSGHSAGGYLASMIGLDKRWLAEHGIDADRIAGLMPLSGHTITHFTPRKERGIPGTQAIIDDLAPLYHVRADAPPMLLITGGRELELLGRYEETAYFWRMMQLVGHPNTQLLELDGHNHGEMVPPSFPMMLKFIRELEAAEE
ncbi:alpha/beta hydrolase [Mucisphaera sp.]|uniref:alpha/beta hydrolase n=1 Tax=Mucisphaera sp. TaxID=2913024 RepID=UPI003D135868